MQSYTVLPGDTLYGISKQFGVSVNDIKLQNNLKNNIINLGEVLIIPSIATSILYTVKKGDTLYSISKRYGVSVNEISRVNNLTSSVLTIGQTLFIPINDSIDEFNYYTVLKGDTLYSISRKFNTTVDSLKKLNNLNSNLLSVGEQIKVPSGFDNNYSDDLIYVVKEGDTLYSISKKYDVSVDSIKKLNNLINNNLYVGQKLLINNTYSNNIISGSSCFGEGYSEIKYLTHTVKKGDNLYDLSKKYGVSIESIKKLNDLINNNLSIGQVLKIKEV